MTTSAQISAPRTLRPAAKARTAGWVVRRALIGLTLLGIFAIGGAALLHATIDPDTSVADSLNE
jgi:hypothetical protein